MPHSAEPKHETFETTRKSWPSAMRLHALCPMHRKQKYSREQALCLPETRQSSVSVFDILPQLLTGRRQLAQPLGCRRTSVLEPPEGCEWSSAARRATRRVALRDVA